MDRRDFLSAVCTATTAAVALPASSRSAAPMRANDIALVREILTTLHPGLYRYASPKAIDAGLTELERSWGNQSLEARFLSLARFLSTIKCGHSYPNFFNQKRQIATKLFDPETPYRLPFAFRWLDGRMVVTQDQARDGGLPVGSIVTSIGGEPVRRILDRLLPYVRADGGNDAKRRALLSATGTDEIETFDIFYGLLYGAPSSGLFDIGYHAPGARHQARVELKPLSWSERKTFINQADRRDSDKPIWDWTMRADGVAILKMDGWAMYNSKWSWEAWLNDRLDSLNGTKGLVVDIRENEGGNDCGDVILSRLTGRDILRPRGKRLVRYDKVPAHLNVYLDTWDDSFRDWGDKVRPYNDRFFEQVGDVADPVIPAREPRIDVPMAVLTSAQNSSATFQFATLCKASGLGTLIGEATGGNRRGINGGAFFFARLPESGLEFDVPLVGYFPERKMPDAGVEPDIKVAVSASDIASGADRQLDVAIAYLLRK